MALKKTPPAGRPVKPALPHGKPNPPIPHFVPVRAPGAPKATTDVGNALGTVAGAGVPQDFSSRQPGQPFKQPPA